MERPFTPAPFLKSDKQGVPKILKPLLPLLKGNTNEKRIALTITKSYMLIQLPPSEDISSITDKKKGQQLRQRIQELLLEMNKKIQET